MKRSSTNLRRRATATAGTALLVLLAGCSDSGESDRTGGDTEPRSAPSGTRSTAQLEGAAVTGNDLPGQRITGRMDKDRIKPAQVTTSQPECLIQAQIAAGIAVGDPASVAERTAVGNVTEESRAGLEERELTTTVTLASYTGKGAEDVLFDLGKAGTVCRTPFDVTVRGETLKAQSVPETKDPGGGGLGDSYAWFTLTRGAGTDAVTHQVLVVEMGRTLGFISREHPGGTTAQAPVHIPFPEAIAKVQVKKFRSS
ncbi:hypothetical protein DY218_29470 [Streptomyces triticagri]|uniref:Lipoprotein n=1 Tax=Streptomyces triticagri TaxID=2293568 RepID=A0A372LX45_9ACTN|nr:hypothetical protein [Streptomyces triticagri]RFU83119.1 hypothetical protein DY218_29470 [Streptomyces triticagri]